VDVRYVIGSYAKRVYVGKRDVPHSSYGQMRTSEGSRLERHDGLGESESEHEGPRLGKSVRSGLASRLFSPLNYLGRQPQRQISIDPAAISRNPSHTLRRSYSYCSHVRGTSDMSNQRQPHKHSNSNITSFTRRVSAVRSEAQQCSTPVPMLANCLSVG
jgi:hypothetical protein